MLYDWNWSQVEREYKRALELDPNYATAHQRYAIYLAAMGRFTEARAEIQRAQQADPVSLIINTDVGLISYLQHQNDLAIEQYRATLDMDPNFSVAHFTLGLAEEQKGQFTQAVSELERAIQLSAGSPLYEAALGHAYAMGGRRAEAEKILNALTETPQPRYVSPYGVATIYVGLGAKDQALKWLEKAYTDRSVWLVHLCLGVDPRLDPLRSEPHFQDLLQRIGLQQ